jgi:hypothetical protein
VIEVTGQSVLNDFLRRTPAGGSKVVQLPGRYVRDSDFHADTLRLHAWTCNRSGTLRNASSCLSHETIWFQLAGGGDATSLCEMAAAPVLARRRRAVMRPVARIWVPNKFIQRRETRNDKACGADNRQRP